MNMQARITLGPYVLEEYYQHTLRLTKDVRSKWNTCAEKGHKLFDTHDIFVYRCKQLRQLL